MDPPNKKSSRPRRVSLQALGLRPQIEAARLAKTVFVQIDCIGGNGADALEFAKAVADKPSTAFITGRAWSAAMDVAQSLPQ